MRSRAENRKPTANSHHQHPDRLSSGLDSTNCCTTVVPTPLQIHNKSGRMGSEQDRMQLALYGVVTITNRGNAANITGTPTYTGCALTNLWCCCQMTSPEACETGWCCSWCPAVATDRHCGGRCDKTAVCNEWATSRFITYLVGPLSPRQVGQSKVGGGGGGQVLPVSLRKDECSSKPERLGLHRFDLLCICYKTSFRHRINRNSFK